VKYIAAVALFPFPFRQWLLLGTLRVACLFMLSQKQQLSWLQRTTEWKDEEKILCFIP
jgi:hypothetical protein